MFDMNKLRNDVCIKRAKKRASVDSERSKISDASDFELMDHSHDDSVGVEKRSSKSSKICSSKMTAMNQNHRSTNSQKNKKQSCTNFKIEKTVCSSQGSIVNFQKQKKTTGNSRCNKVSDNSKVKASSDSSQLSSESNKCPHCKITYSDFNSRVNHICLPYPCSLCFASFRHDFELKMHKSSKHDSENDKELSSEKTPKEESSSEMTQKGESLSENTQKGESSSEKIKKEESLSEKVQKGVKCSICEEVFQTWNSLFAHRSRCKDKYFDKCEMCNKCLPARNKSGVFCNTCRIVIDKSRNDHSLRHTLPKSNLNVLRSNTLDSKELPCKDITIPYDSSCTTNASNLNINETEELSENNKSRILNVYDKRKVDDISHNFSDTEQQTHQPKIQKKKHEMPSVNEKKFSDSDKMKTKKSRAIKNVKNVFPISEICTKSKRNTNVNFQQNELLPKKHKTFGIHNFKDSAFPTSNSSKDIQKSVRKKGEICNDEFRRKSRSFKQKLEKQAPTKLVKKYHKGSNESEKFTAKDTSYREELNKFEFVKRNKSDTESSALKGPSEQLSQEVLSIENIIKSLPDSDSGILLLPQNKNNPSFMCAKCQKLFKQEKLASIHYSSCKFVKQKKKLVALSEVKWLCTLCHSSYSQISGLYVHKKSCLYLDVAGAGLSMKVCSNCGFSCTSSFSFQNHSCQERLKYMQSCYVQVPKFVIPHTYSEQILPLYVCPVCEKIFSDVILSQSHLLKHPGERRTVMSLRLHLKKRHLHPNVRCSSLNRFPKQNRKPGCSFPRPKINDSIKLLQSHMNQNPLITQVRIKKEKTTEEEDSNVAVSSVQNSTFSSSQLTRNINSVYCQTSSAVQDVRISNNQQINPSCSSNAFANANLPFSQTVTSVNLIDTTNPQHIGAIPCPDLSGMPNGNTLSSCVVSESQPDTSLNSKTILSSTLKSRNVPSLNLNHQAASCTINENQNTSQTDVFDSPVMPSHVNQQYSQSDSLNTDNGLKSVLNNYQFQENFRLETTNDTPSTSTSRPIMPETDDNFLSFMRGLIEGNTSVEKLITLSECRCKNAKIGPEGEEKPCPRCSLFPGNNVNDIDLQPSVDSSFGLLIPKEEILDCQTEELVKNLLDDMNKSTAGMPASFESPTIEASQPSPLCESNTFNASHSHMYPESVTSVTVPITTSYVDTTTSVAGEANISCASTSSISSQVDSSYKDTACTSSQGQVPYQVLQTPRSCLTPPLTPGGIFASSPGCSPQPFNILDSQPSCSTDRTERTVTGERSQSTVTSSSSVTIQVLSNANLDTFYLGATKVQIHETFDITAADGFTTSEDIKTHDYLCAKCYGSCKINNFLAHLLEEHNIKDKNVINIVNYST
ncbi:uncharacterized protein LOC118205719 [Stegodyphus dumicola]|uniref:uncharacterized protein LOC118205719 n=1 Tax=Stegodyphus dumicola TaxID=202533 RepID=UPI0015AA7488|nr:uncharacterized protein LOC118205719 [Stegodyphus dumicola]XP_035233903.1 uncharacterized protein LOC118205719 [Stegodyphus dumicola]